MTEMNTKSFISSIKIKGLYFLPPVITEEKRIELQNYKQEALKIEKRLKYYKDLEKSLQELSNFRPISEQSHNSVSEISFNDSHLKALGISPRPSEISHRPKKEVHLSTDIIDITEYGSNGIKILESKQITDQNYEQGQNGNLNKPDIILSPPTSNTVNFCISGSSPKSLSPVKPRLIRSNSYTIENPSPILLAHLEKCGDTKSDDKKKQTDDVTNCTSINNWSSSDENYASLENSDFSSLSTVYKNESFEKDKNIINLTEKTSPQIELIHADISVQHLTVHNNVAEEKEITKNTFELSDPNNQLLQILKNIPDDYSKRIIDLIEKECKEQEKEMEAIKKDMGSDRSKAEQNSNCENLRNKDDISLCSVESPDKLRSVSAATISPSTWLPNSPSFPIIDLEYDNKSGGSEYFISETSPKPSLGELRFSSCKKLLPYDYSDFNYATMNDIKKEHAATIICAYAKGYLTRRLLKTDRVQSLISTIRDALVCALQLHSADNIDESDVELHRRLINQVTAACYAFHDIFFALSISEQMYMISTDRQHRLEKAKRPASAPQPRRPTSIKKKQRMSSLTKSVTKV